MLSNVVVVLGQNAVSVKAANPKKCLCIVVAPTPVDHPTHRKVQLQFFQAVLFIASQRKEFPYITSFFLKGNISSEFLRKNQRKILMYIDFS